MQIYIPHGISMVEVLSLQLLAKPDYKKMAIYLNHRNSNHFEIVLKVIKEGCV